MQQQTNIEAAIRRLDWRSDEGMGSLDLMVLVGGIIILIVAGLALLQPAIEGLIQAIVDALTGSS